MTEKKITTQEDFEKDYKQKLFDRIELLCSAQSKLLENIKNAEDYLDIELDIELPNIGITFNNKIIELLHHFQDAGISMFSQTFENYGTKKSKFISSSFIGDAIIFYMLGKTEEAVLSAYNYHAKLDALIKLEKAKCEAFYSANPLKKFYLTTRCLVAVPPELDFSHTEKDINELSSYASNYAKIDDELWKSTLRDFTIPSLITHIKRTNQSKENIPSLLNENIIPYLEKLGLSDLIPELRKEISKLFEKSKFDDNENER